MKFLTVEEVISIHDDLVKLYGGLAGIRDMGLLLSAIEMPKASMFGEYLHETIFDKAAAYIFHIVNNHAFLDGNKRTGLAVGLVFLEMNEIGLETGKKLEDMVCDVAQGKLNKESISLLLQSMSETSFLTQP